MLLLTTKYNSAGKHGNGVRFSIKPRTRPRWYRDADSGRRDGSLGNDKDNGKRRDSRNPRLESEHDRRGGGRRPTFAGARTEARSHESYEDGQVRGVEITRPEGRGYYGQRIGDRGLRAPDSGRGGREERSSRTTPPPRRQAVPDEEGDLARPGSCKDARGGDSRSRMLPGGSAKDSIPDRSRPTSRMLSRLGPSPPRRSRSGERSQRNNESPDGCRTRCDATPESFFMCGFPLTGFKVQSHFSISTTNVHAHPGLKTSKCNTTRYWPEVLHAANVSTLYRSTKAITFPLLGSSDALRCT